LKYNFTTPSDEHQVTDIKVEFEILTALVEEFCLLEYNAM
jgi:hypothetical protein